MESTLNVNSLVKWLEKEEIAKKERPSLIVKSNDANPSILILSFLIIVGLAFIILEEKGKIKTKKSAHKKTSEDFIDLIKHGETEKDIEKLIESRYDVDLIVKNNLSSPHTSKLKKYGLDDVFGIWQSSPIALDKIRESQWQRKR